MVGRRGKGAPKLAQTRFKALTLTGLEELQDFHVIDVALALIVDCRFVFIREDHASGVLRRVTDRVACASK